MIMVLTNDQKKMLIVYRNWLSAVSEFNIFMLPSSLHFVGNNRNIDCNINYT